VKRPRRKSRHLHPQLNGKNTCAPKHVTTFRKRRFAEWTKIDLKNTLYQVQAENVIVHSRQKTSFEMFYKYRFLVGIFFYNVRAGLTKPFYKYFVIFILSPTFLQALSNPFPFYALQCRGGGWIIRKFWCS
jgi:hypothetical protein